MVMQPCSKLSRIRDHLAADRRVIGYKLLNPKDVKNIKSTTAPNDDQCLHMLIKWLETGPSASYSTLIDALNKHGLLKMKVLK